MIPLIESEILAHQETWKIPSSALTNFIAISEATPGPFAINIATFVGTETAGPLGALVATLGVVLPSFIIILIVATILSKFLNNKYIRGALNGVRPVTIALILSTSLFFLLKMLFANGNSFNIYSDIRFDRASFGILAILVLLSLIYKKIKKKSINPIALLGISALLGLIIFSTI